MCKIYFFHDGHQNEQNLHLKKNKFFLISGILTLSGALSAFAAGFLNSKKFDRWDLWILSGKRNFIEKLSNLHHSYILTGCSVLEGGLILWSSLTNNVWVAYAMYILFGTVYHFMITMARCVSGFF